MRHLPPLLALRSFEAIARQGSIKAASEELCVTQSAISHQLHKLETFLGAPLFHRRNRRLILTDAGQDYLLRVAPAFDQIETATLQAVDAAGQESLTLSAPTSFFALWLLPRLEQFNTAHPHLSLRVRDHLTREAAGEEARLLDCAIEYRMQPPANMQSTVLIHDEIVPLASPDFIAQHNIRTLDDLNGLVLIETERRLVSWQALLKDHTWFRGNADLVVQYSYHAFEAASLGLGIALGNRTNAGRAISAGRLAIPFELPAEALPPTPRYYLTASHEKARLPKVQAFMTWVHHQLAAQHRGSVV